LATERQDRRTSGPISRYARGTSLVELAIILPVFLLLVFAGIEIGRFVLELSRTVEATRAGVRVAVVTTPPAACITAGTACSGSCLLSQADPDQRRPVLAVMQQRQPRLQPGQVRLEYVCSTAGSVDRPTAVPVVTVRVEGLRHQLLAPLLPNRFDGFPLPQFPSTLLGESLYSLPPA
jgi:hypothetical protein